MVSVLLRYPAVTGGHSLAALLDCDQWSQSCYPLRPGVSVTCRYSVETSGLSLVVLSLSIIWILSSANVDGKLHQFCAY